MRRPKAGDAWRTRTRARRDRVERLEPRVLLSAGDLDITFGGGDGIVTTDFGGAETALDVALLPGGKILVGGTGGVLRYNADGTLDRSFGGGDGRADITGAITALAVDESGVILGVSSGGVVRFTSGGVRDMGFGGGDGVATAPGGSFPSGFADVGVLPNGRIVAAPERFLGLVAFDPAGNLDTTFGGGDGVVSSNLIGHTAEAGSQCLAVQPNGKVVVGGFIGLQHGIEGSWPGLAVARYGEDGIPDGSFAPGGEDESGGC